MKFSTTSLVFLSLTTAASANVDVKNEYWSLSTNDACVIEGPCIKSHPGAGVENYNNHEDCDFVAQKAGILVERYFESESHWDWLRVHGDQVSGNDFNPSSVMVQAGDPVAWHTDYADVRKGFHICLEPVENHAYWYLSTNDACVIEGPCIKSHPGAGKEDYNNYEDCDFVALKAGRLVERYFESEAVHDWLRVHGDEVSGVSWSSLEVQVGDPLAWHTDGSVVKKGFHICLDPVVGSNGDPHVNKWSGEQYDFHGECDLVLLDNADFHHGLGMTIHIRTKIHSWWSHIQSAVVRIGEDTIEVTGGDAGKYYVNGVEGDNTPNKKNVFQISPLGLEVTTNRVTDHQLSVRLDLDNSDGISIETYKHFVRVNMKEKSPELKKFAGSVGLMGRYPAGETIGRDGKTVFTDMNAFGQEWQVLDSEPKLFRTESDVQHPKKCVMPTVLPTEEQRRRLGESVVITQEEAEAACARVAGKIQRDACVFDVLATNDKDMAGSY